MWLPWWTGPFCYVRKALSQTRHSNARDIYQYLKKHFTQTLFLLYSPISSDQSSQFPVQFEINPWYLYDYSSFVNMFAEVEIDQYDEWNSGLGFLFFVFFMGMKLSRLTSVGMAETILGRRRSNTLSCCRTRRGEWWWAIVHCGTLFWPITCTIIQNPLKIVI